MSAEEKSDADQGRSIKYDSLIVKFNQLAKYIRMQGKKAAWRDALGHEKDYKINRKKIGDMELKEDIKLFEEGLLYECCKDINMANDRHTAKSIDLIKNSR
ncbi:hypothetical protein [Hungatella hathewayi]|uniref:hypothetical protein n=1 Tax=Hungatella hathewayi TaxID=154046 RepID=UPI003566564E